MLAAAIGISLLGTASRLVAAEDSPRAVFIGLGAGNTPQVILLDDARGDQVKGKGILLWSEAISDRWQVIDSRASVRTVLEGRDVPTGGSRLRGFSRGEESIPGDIPGDALTAATVQIDQLLGQGVVRASRGFLTPVAGGRHLDPRITVRRLAERGQKPYPQVTLVLARGNAPLLRIPLAENQASIAWGKVPALPAELKEGLPPGEYTLVFENGEHSTRFVVEEAQTREQVIGRLDELGRLLGTKDDPLWIQAAVETLLGHADADGRALPYAADALSQLERVPDKTVSAHLTRLKAHLLAEMQGENASPILAGDSVETGIAHIDDARRLIARGQWREASAKLESGQDDASARRRALESLYRAVILSESGQGLETAAAGHFAEAIDMAGSLSPSDAFRIYNNAGNFALGCCQDRLYNHAFQIATGAQHPLLDSALNWQRSLSCYQRAMGLAAALGPGDQAAVRVNLARLYAILADLVRTLDPPVAGKRRLADLEAAATDRSQEMASEVAAQNPAIAGSMISAAACEISAHLVFRRGDLQKARVLAEQAAQRYLDGGSLPGVEGCERLLGLCSLRSAKPDSGAEAVAARQEALRHFQISHLLAEVLREQCPADRVGLARAGFFARRAYVNERIVELLVSQGNAAEALSYVELAKARTLGDVLAAKGKGVDEAGGSRTLAEIRASWPKDVAALEYFLGTEQAWVFLVKTDGNVAVARLTDANGAPLASRDLVARVQTFLAELDHSARKMHAHIQSTHGLDNRWQDELHRFFHELVPKPFLAEIRKAKTVLIVPHHILHYFPFAALVTERDPKPRTGLEIVQPKFLVDEPFCVAYAPSLATWDLLRSKDDRPMTSAAALGIVDFAGGARLAGVEKDLANFKTLFGTRVQRIVPGDEATVGAAKQLLKQRGLLLMATHGLNLADNPLKSFLVLQSDADHEGRLTAEEIYGTEVARDLIVMSACYSGLADRSPLPGDDLFGLQRGLLHSGSRAVVCGLWDVYEDTAPELIRLMFDQLTQGKPVAVALAESQRQFLKKLRASPEVEFWLHPYFWAVFAVAGDDRTHFFNERNAR
jgi:CHAT domain-containing protein